MAAGGEIKVVLTLDDSGFSVKTRKAQDLTEALEQRFKSAAKSSKSVEAEIGNLGKKLESTSVGIGELNRSLGGFKDAFEGIRASMRETALQIGTFAKSLNAISDTKVGRAISSTAKEVNKLKEALSSLKPSLKEAVDGQKAFGDATERSARQARLANQQAVLSNEERLKSEIDTNRQLMSEKRAFATQMSNQARKLRDEEEKHRRMAAEAERRYGPIPSKYIVEEHTARADVYANNAALLERQIEGTKQYISELNRLNVAKREELNIEQENIAKFAAEDEARRAAMRDLQSAGNSRIAMARRVGKVEREEISQTTDMLKGMAALWGAAKIDGALKSSVTRAGDYQRNVTLLDGLNLPKDQRNHILNQSTRIASQLGFVDRADALRSYRGAIGIIGSDNPAIIDKSLPTALKAARSVAFAAGDMSSEAINNNLLNIVGFAKSRGQLSAEGIINNANLLQKIAIATGGKMTLADMEMIAKRNLGGMPYVTNEGFAKEVALAEELKTSGHNGGGGGNSGAGVSLLGSSMAMIQKMMEGGLKTKEAALTMERMGVLNADTFDPKRAGSRIAALRQAGLTMGDMSMADPVAAIQKFVEASMAYMTNAKNKKHYFGTKDINNQEARSLAMARLATEMGFSKNVVTWLENVANPDVFKNSQHLSKQMLNAKGADAQNAAINQTYVGNVQNFNKALHDLQIEMGEKVLPLVTEFIHGLTDVVKVASDFAKNHPIVSEMTMIGGAVGSAILAFKGFKSMFGIVGDVRTIMRSLTGVTQGVGEAAVESGASFKSFGASIRANALAAMIQFNGVGGISGTIGGFRRLGSIVADTGKALARLALYAPQFLAAWDIGYAIGTMIEGWLDKIKVGTHRITDELGRTLQVIGNSVANTFSNQASELRRNYQFGVDSQNSGFGNGSLNSAMSQVAEYANSPDPKTRAMAQQIIKDEAHRQMLLHPHLHAQAGGKGAPHQAPSSHPGLNGTPYTGDAGDAGTKKGKRAPEDLFVQAFGNLQNRLLTLNEQVAQMNGTADPLATAKQYVATQFNNGQYDVGHNALTRERFLKHGYRFDNATQQYFGPGNKQVTAYDAIDWKKKVGGHSLGDMAHSRAQLEQEKQAYQGIDFAIRRAAAAKEKLREVTLAATLGYTKESQAMQALRMDYARQEATNPALLKNKNYLALKQKALLDEALAEAQSGAAGLNGHFANLSKIAASFKIATPQIAQRDTNGQMLNLQAREQRIAGSHLAMIRKAMLEGKISRQENTLVAHTAGGGKVSVDLSALKAMQLSKAQVTQLQEKVTNLTDMMSTVAPHSAEWNKLSQQRDTYKGYLSDNALVGAIIGKQKALTPLQKTTAGWQDVHANLQSQSVQWANDFLGAIEQGVSTGHFRDSLRSAFASVLTSVRNDIIQKLLAQPIETFVSKLAGTAETGIGKLFSGGSGSAARSAGSSLWSGISSIASTGMNWLSTHFGNGGASAPAAGSSVASNPSFWSWVGTLFADGGVMTPYGQMELRKYANGGVANSPQLAVFGEGSMNEAYVPLPDGRSIPVTMTASGNGGKSQSSQSQSSQGGQNVTISIVVNSGSSTPQTSASGDTTGAWGAMAKKVQQVVQNELVQQQRPGGMLYQGK